MSNTRDELKESQSGKVEVQQAFSQEPGLTSYYSRGLWGDRDDNPDEVNSLFCRKCGQPAKLTEVKHHFSDGPAWGKAPIFKPNAILATPSCDCQDPELAAASPISCPDCKTVLNFNDKLIAQHTCPAKITMAI